MQGVLVYNFRGGRALVNKFHTQKWRCRNYAKQVLTCIRGSLQNSTSWCSSLQYCCWTFLIMYSCPYLPVFTYIYTGLPMITTVLSCLPIIRTDYTPTCLPMFTHDYLCLPMITLVYLSLPLLTRTTYAYSCLPVYHCLIVHSYLYLPILLELTYVYPF